MEVKIEIDTYSKWLIVKNISVLSYKENFTVKDIAKSININPLHPFFNKLMQHLIQIDVFEIVEINGTTRVLHLTKKGIDVLDKMVENAKPYQEFRDYVYRKKDFYADI